MRWPPGCARRPQTWSGSWHTDGGCGDTPIWVVWRGSEGCRSDAGARGGNSTRSYSAIAADGTTGPSRENTR